MRTRALRPASLLAACTRGFHFCRTCQRVSADLSENWFGQFVCPFCGSARTQWRPPVLSSDQTMIGGKHAR